MAESPKRKGRRKAWLLGVGLDNEDGHTRITKGENFALLGGSDSTHSLMQEKAIKLNEHLKRRGKTLDSVSPGEFLDIAHKLKMPVAIPDGRRALPPATPREE